MSKMNNIPLLYNGPDEAKSLYIFAHGAGAPMDTEFMNYFTDHLADAGVRILRFEFPYMALRRDGHGGRPPNGQKILLETWRQVISKARETHKGAIYIGGKSMGGRMASMIADECSVSGLILLGYPFYAPKKIDKPRIEHLIDIKTPTLILQGERDVMGSKEVVEKYPLSKNINISWVTDGDHGLVPRKKSGLTSEDNYSAAITIIRNFLKN